MKFNEETDDVGGRKKEMIDGGFFFGGTKIFYNSRIHLELFFGGSNSFWWGEVKK